MTNDGDAVSVPQVYGATYYGSHCGNIPYDRSQPHWGEFFGKIADELISAFRPRRVFDAGCALGFLVEALWDRGVPAYGRDISEYAIANARVDIRQYCSVGSLVAPIEGRFDLVTCIEVLEHMTEAEGMAAIANMTAAADRIVFSSSPTDLTEPTHINVKPPIYWIQAFAAHNFAPLVETTLFSITPYALAFERRQARPSDDYLHACAEIVRSRMTRANEAGIVVSLSVTNAELDRIVASLRAELERMAAERQRALDELAAAQRSIRELTTENSKALDELATASGTLVRMRDSQDELFDAQIHLHDLIDEINRSGLWRIVRELDRIVRRMHLVRPKTPSAASLMAKAKSTALLGFDNQFYLEQNPDVASAGVDALRHFLSHGRLEGRARSRLDLESIVQTRPARESSETLFLNDLCDPQHEEPGAKVFDETFVITVLTPTYNTDPRFIRELYQTLVNQTYGNWEWVVVDDGSYRTNSIAIIGDISRNDPRVRFRVNPKNLGIAGASNVGLAAARGTHIALVDHDDLVSRHAFHAVYQAWKQSPNAHLFYTDECKLHSDGRLSDLWAKPDWSPAYLEYTMYVAHLSVYNRKFLDELGGFRSEFDGTQDYDLALRALLRDPVVVHVPVFGYLWRVIPGSAAASQTEKSYAIERQERAVLGYARARHPDATVARARHDGYWRIVYPLTPLAPLLSYIIPAGGGVRTIRGGAVELVVNCVRSFESKAFYPNSEYVVVHNGNLPAAQVRALSAIPNVRLVHHAEPAFNFSRTVNAGVAAASGEFICLVNDDVEALTEHGGEELVSYLAVNTNVGAIGPKCLFEDGRIQQCGVILLADGPAHAATGQPRDFTGHNMGLLCRHETYCLGAAMLVMRKSVFEEVGGFRDDLPLNYNDVDFSLRMRDRGYTCVVDPAVEVYHLESSTKIGTANIEQERMFLTRADTRDPYFSKWFDPRSPSFQLNLKAPDLPRPFGAWLDRHIARRAAALCQVPGLKIAICVVATDQPLRYLDEAVRAATMQTHDNVQVVVINAGIHDPQVREWFEALKRREIATVEMNGDGSLGALAVALRTRIDVEFVVFLQAGDVVSVDALQLVAHNIAGNPSQAVFYTDSYEVDDYSIRKNPFFKPDFDPILLTNLWYTGYLVATKADFLWRVCETESIEPFSSVDTQVVLRCVRDGEGPQHIREAAYGRRSSAGVPRDFLDLGARRRAVGAMIQAAGAADVLTVEPQSDDPDSLLRLKAGAVVSGVKIMEAQAVWGEGGCGVLGLTSAAEELGVRWIAILLVPDNQQAMLDLSALAMFDLRVNAVCGVLLDAENLVQWSGGVFLPGGRVFDPQAGRSIADGGYRGLLSCQRCVDVAAPVNVLIRAETIARVVDRFAVVDADGLMVAIGLDAAERGELVAVTHCLTAISGRDMPPPPADRRGIVRNNSVLDGGSRWYDGRLEIERPFMMPGFG